MSQEFSLIKRNNEIEKAVRKALLDMLNTTDVSIKKKERIMLPNDALDYLSERCAGEIVHIIESS